MTNKIIEKCKTCKNINAYQNRETGIFDDYFCMLDLEAFETKCDYKEHYVQAFEPKQVRADSDEC